MAGQLRFCEAGDEVSERHGLIDQEGVVGRSRVGTGVLSSASLSIGPPSVLRTGPITAVSRRSESI